MYNVKVNGNYNVLINDINVYVSPNHVNGVDIDEKAYKTSKDIQSLVKAGIIVVNPAGSKEAKTEAKAAKVEEPKKERAFVREVAAPEAPKDIFVAQPKEETIVVEETKVEEPKAEEKVEEVKVETKTSKEEKVEVTVKAEKTTTKKAEKPAAKKSTKNTKSKK